MSDATPTPEVDAKPAQAAAPSAESVKPNPPPVETDWKAEARKWEQRAKDNGSAADELQKIRDANLSDLEKAQKAAADAQDAAAKATAEALRLRVAAKHGISDEDADLFLTGSDAETLDRQAARLVERTPATSAGPRPDLSQGSKGGDAATDKTAAFVNFLNQTA